MEIVSILGLIVAVIGVYFAYRQWKGIKPPGKTVSIYVKALSGIKAKDMYGSVYKGPNNMYQQVVLERAERSQKSHNSVPILSITITNKGKKIQLTDLVLEFNKSQTGSEGNEITAVSILSMRDMAGNSMYGERVIIEEDQDMQITLSNPFFSKTVMEKGIKSIFAKDVHNNKYFADDSTFPDVRDYLIHFYGQDDNWIQLLPK